MMKRVQRGVDVADVQTILRKIAESVPEPDATALLEQIDTVRVCGGVVTMLDLEVAADAAKISRGDGPLPESAVVVDAGGRDVGELLIWVTEGHISNLEYAWWTDDPPVELPRVTQLRMRPARTG